MPLNKKQQEVIDCVKTENPKILVCSGAKRAGKTYVLIWIFLGHIAKFRNKGLSFILGGATQASLRRNVLDDMEDILGKKLTLDKTNAVEIFGNKVYCFDGANSDAWKKVRGFTAAGAFLNEGTALHESFVREVQSRCSYPGARIYIDTNPENPAHYIKTDYIDNDGQLLDSGLVNIRAFQFTLFDNDALTEEYVDSIVKSTPSGMYMDRDVYGRWVSPEGVVYPDFTEALFISPEDIANMDFTSYFVGVDWGYEHYGAIVLCGVRVDGVIVVMKIYAARYQEVDYWTDVAHEIMREYGDIPFYCDSARPEHVKHFRKNDIDAFNAKKAVIAGIEQVARGFKRNMLLIVNNSPRFKEEIYQYVWNETTGEPIKLYDDVMDSIRYAVYTHLITENITWETYIRRYALVHKSEIA
ncbi:MAG: PBSX family phage terminase large subunit [Candidatus Ornithomonoglobus sp.]